MRLRISEEGPKVANYILAVLYDDYLNSAHPGLSKEEIGLRFQTLPPGILNNALERLESNNFAESHQREYDEFYVIMPLGIEYVDEWSDEQFELASRQEAGTTDGSITSINASDDNNETWEPLALERAEPEFSDMIQSVESALQEVRGNNGYAETSPEERDIIVESIEVGLNHTKNSSVTEGWVKETLVKPLKYIAKKFFDSAMGKSASIAIESILKWLAA